LCKTGLNLKKITCGDPKTLHYLLGIEKPQSYKYVILESDIECLSKAVHVIDFQEKSEYEVGRRVTNDITVSDITVSRQHALLMECGNQVYLKDSDSKFGTFQMIRKLKKLKPKEQIAVQIERKVFFIKVDSIKSSCPLMPCFKPAP